MKMETSIHWHGILLPNKEDGVPYLTTAPVKPETTHTVLNGALPIPVNYGCNSKEEIYP